MRTVTIFLRFMGGRILGWIFLSGLVAGLLSCSGRRNGPDERLIQPKDQELEEEVPGLDDNQSVQALLISPAHPRRGEVCRILSVGDKHLRKAQVEVTGTQGKIAVSHKYNGAGLPFWRVDEFIAGAAGRYTVSLMTGSRTVSHELNVAQDGPVVKAQGVLWESSGGWDSHNEALYAAWIGALFRDAGEGASWSSLHAVMQDREHNILYNHLGISEDDPNHQPHVIMEPDCADNPFFFRAYFAWKMGLPFGYHECDRGWLGKAPQSGRWITNQSGTASSHPVLAFNAFMRRLMDAIHSGTARTAFSNENSDYYPVPLTRQALRPGVTFADPYGHTLIVVRWIPQKGNQPGILLSVDAQPDGTVAIKRFWKGNFLFTYEGIIGEPGFKAFRPIEIREGRLRLMKNAEITATPGLIPFSMKQKGMAAADFYQVMERVVNPRPLDPESALLDLIRALHEQLLTRVGSVANGEKYMKAHPGEVIPMPGKATGVFLAGGSWEDFSTPNRDLRLLIAMDAVQEFPDKLLRSPDDYKLPKLSSPEQVKEKLDQLIRKKTSELTITYERTDGSKQILTISDILQRKEVFEMAYNPNDCVEVRWGAMENSKERSACRRRAPTSQFEKMNNVRPWFRKRLHPPT